MRTRYYHGGAPGLRPGDLIEPSSESDERHLVDGCPVCEARRRGKPLDYDRNHRFDRVYVTTQRHLARGFAAGYPRGGLYDVEAIGALEADPEHEASFAVPAVRVKSVVDAVVILRPNEIRRLLEESGLVPAYNRRLRRAGLR